MKIMFNLQSPSKYSVVREMNLLSIKKKPTQRADSTSNSLSTTPMKDPNPPKVPMAPMKKRKNSVNIK